MTQAIARIEGRDGVSKDGDGVPSSDGVGRSKDASARPFNAFTIDVEEHFQVSAFEAAVPRSDWEELASRVENNVSRLLDLLARHETKATFFTLGWVAERHPDMIRRIVNEGHELASHGYSHVRVNTQSAEAFRDDVRKTKAILEDISGIRVLGYRAASFSIGPSTPWALPILREEGHRYSSSTVPIAHDLYGDPSGQRFAYKPFADDNFLEVPVTTLRLFGRNLPCGGGGFFRLLPYAYFRWGYGKTGRESGQPCIFYLHPWEIDPEQPRIAGAAMKSRIRHYTNLGRTFNRLESLLRDFHWTSMARAFL